MMFDEASLVISPRLLSKEAEVYQRQKIVFILIDILFVSYI